MALSAGAMLMLAGGAVGVGYVAYKNGYLGGAPADAAAQQGAPDAGGGGGGYPTGLDPYTLAMLQGGLGAGQGGLGNLPTATWNDQVGGYVDNAGNLIPQNLLGDFGLNGGPLGQAGGLLGQGGPLNAPTDPNQALSLLSPEGEAALLDYIAKQSAEDSRKNTESLDAQTQAILQTEQQKRTTDMLTTGANVALVGVFLAKPVAKGVKGTYNWLTKDAQAAKAAKAETTAFQAEKGLLGEAKAATKIETVAARGLPTEAKLAAQVRESNILSRETSLLGKGAKAGTYESRMALSEFGNAAKLEQRVAATTRESAALERFTAGFKSVKLPTKAAAAAESKAGILTQLGGRTSRVVQSEAQLALKESSLAARLGGRAAQGARFLGRAAPVVDVALGAWQGLQTGQAAQRAGYGGAQSTAFAAVGGGTSAATFGLVGLDVNKNKNAVSTFGFDIASKERVNKQGTNISRDVHYSNLPSGYTWNNPNDMRQGFHYVGTKTRSKLFGFSLPW